MNLDRLLGIVVLFTCVSPLCLFTCVSSFLFTCVLALFVCSEVPSIVPVVHLAWNLVKSVKITTQNFGSS